MTMATRAVCGILICALAACGGKKGKTTPDETGDSNIGEGQETSQESGGGTSESGIDPNVVSNEKMAEISSLLQRRGSAVSRCLAFAIDNKDLPKNSRGKMTLQIVIAPSGSAQEVSVLKTNLESKSLNECVISKVKEIVFPELPKKYETTYTYGFEAL